MKTKDKQISYLELFQSIYKLETFTQKISTTKLIIGNLIFLFLIFVLTTISSIVTYKYQSLIDIFSTIFIGTPIFLLVIFSFMYLFLSAYEKLKKTFSQSFLIFTFLTLGFILIGNTINLIKTLSENNFITILTSTLLFVTVFYYIYNITQNLKNYFNINWQRMFLTQTITYLIMSFSVVAYWINILIKALN
jgi:hypothetical protein